MSSQQKPELPAYRPPQTGILSLVPPSWVPYGELARFDKPTGIYLFYFPHLFGTLLAAYLARPYSPSTNHDLLIKNIILFLGTIFMRSAACAWNDNMDREYDRQIFRCRLRPVARGALTPLQAHVFTVTQTMIAASFLCLLPTTCLFVATPSIFLLWLYPFAKRFTQYPQLVLGFHIALGIYLGMSAMGYDVWTDKSPTRVAATVAFYLACVAWTVVYDTIYAHQDLKDDIKAGVKSMAVRFQHSAKTVLFSTAALQVLLLVAAGILGKFSVSYFSITCAGTAIALVYMISAVDLNQPAECMWWFKNGCWLVGSTIAGGLVKEYLLKAPW